MLIDEGDKWVNDGGRRPAGAAASLQGQTGASALGASTELYLRRTDQRGQTARKE